MKTYQHTKSLFITDHKRKPLAQPQRRINALYANTSTELKKPVINEKS